MNTTIARIGAFAIVTAGLIGGPSFAAKYKSAFDGSAQECTECYCSVDQYGNEIVLNSDGSFHAHVATSADGSCNCVDTANGAIFVPVTTIDPELPDLSVEE